MPSATHAQGKCQGRAHDHAAAAASCAAPPSFTHPQPQPHHISHSCTCTPTHAHAHAHTHAPAIAPALAPTPPQRATCAFPPALSRAYLLMAEMMAAAGLRPTVYRNAKVLYDGPPAEVFNPLEERREAFELDGVNRLVGWLFRGRCLTPWRSGGRI